MKGAQLHRIIFGIDIGYLILYLIAIALGVIITSPELRQAIPEPSDMGWDILLYTALVIACLPVLYAIYIIYIFFSSIKTNHKLLIGFRVFNIIITIIILAIDTYLLTFIYKPGWL